MVEASLPAVDLRCEQLGLPPPPGPVRLEIVRAEGAWEIRVSAPGVPSAAIVAWLEALAPKELLVDAGHDVTAFFDGPCGALASLLAEARAEVFIAADGSLRVESAKGSGAARVLSAGLRG